MDFAFGNHAKVMYTALSPKQRILKNEYTFVSFIDLEKAFHRIDQNLLSYKLPRYY